MRLAKELTPSSPILRNQTFSPNCFLFGSHLVAMSPLSVPPGEKCPPPAVLTCRMLSLCFGSLLVAMSPSSSSCSCSSSCYSYYHFQRNNSLHAKSAQGNCSCNVPYSPSRQETNSPGRGGSSDMSRSCCMCEPVETAQKAMTHMRWQPNQSGRQSTNFTQSVVLRVGWRIASTKHQHQHQHKQLSESGAS